MYRSGIIPKSSIRRFMQRERRSFDHWKAKTPEQLEQEVRALPVHPPIWNKLRKLQRVCLLLGIQQKRFAFWNDTGTGKTLLSVALARYFKAAGIAKQHLVLVERKVNKWEWAREIKKHSDTKYCVLNGSSEHKWQQFDRTDATIIIDSYASFMHMVCTIQHNKRTGKNKMQWNAARINRVCKKVKGLFLDESYNAKNREKLPFRICRQLAKRCSIVFALTGTPFGRNPLDLWAQCYLIDQGYTFGETLGLFRASFFTAREDLFGRQEWTFDRGKERLLNEFLKNISIRYEIDAAELPRLVAIKKYVELPDNADVYYQRARETLANSRGNYRECKNAFLRMRQISSGFVGFYDDESGAKASYEFPDNPKLDMLCSVVQAVDRYKIIVFHEFILSGNKIVTTLRKLGIKCLLINGHTQEPKHVLQSFDRDKDVQVLALNNAMGSGLNLQVARYGIYYESPLSPIVRKQTRRRFERQYSKHSTVFQYDLITRGTVDERILQFLKSGENLFEAVLNGKVTL